MHLAMQSNSTAASLEENVVEVKYCCVSVSPLKWVYSSQHEPSPVIKQMSSFLALQTNGLWEIAMLTMCMWILEFTEPISNVNLNSWPSYRNPLSRGITMTFPLVRQKVTVWLEGIPTWRSWVCSLLLLLVSLLPTASTTCYWRCCLALLSHSMSCLAGPLQFLLARVCAFTTVVLCSHAIFFPFPVSPSLAVGESQ